MPAFLSAFSLFATLGRPPSKSALLSFPLPLSSRAEQIPATFPISTQRMLVCQPQQRRGQSGDRDRGGEGGGLAVEEETLAAPLPKKVIWRGGACYGLARVPDSGSLLLSWKGFLRSQATNLSAHERLREADRERRARSKQINYLLAEHIELIALPFSSLGCCDAVGE